VITVVGAIIYAVIAATAAGVLIACLYERKLYRNEHAVNEDLIRQLWAKDNELQRLKVQLARLEGISQGRECDSMQRRFLEQLQSEGQATTNLSRRRST